MTPQDFSAKLTAALAHRGWSQSDLARSAGLRRDAISTYCRAAVMPSKAFLDKIAKALDVSAAELLDGKLSPPAAGLPQKPKKVRAPRGKAALPSAGVELKHESSGDLRLRLDLSVTVDQAMQILTILRS